MRRIRPTPQFDDGYPTCSRTWASLCIYPPGATDPQTISDVLGIAATTTQERRDYGRAGRRNRPAAWFLESKDRVVSKDVRRHIVWLLDALGERATRLKQLQDNGAIVVVSCFWESAHGHGGPTLDAPLLRRLGALNLEVWFDVYLDSPNDPLTHAG